MASRPPSEPKARKNKTSAWRPKLHSPMKFQVSALRNLSAAWLDARRPRDHLGYGFANHQKGSQVASGTDPKACRNADRQGNDRTYDRGKCGVEKAPLIAQSHGVIPGQRPAAILIPAGSGMPMRTAGSAMTPIAMATDRRRTNRPQNTTGGKSLPAKASKTGALKLTSVGGERTGRGPTHTPV